jgi:hypothetical protein
VASKLKRPKIPSLHDLIEDESELVNAFVARANTPTVTLPRIKTGDKWRHIAGFNDVLKREENFHWLITSFTIGIIGLMILQKEILSFLCYVFVYIQKLADVHALKKNWPAQLVYAISVCHIMKTILNRDIRKLPKAVLPILAVITPAHNLILLPIHVFLERIIRVGLEPRAFMNAYYFFGWALFFQMGNSNGLASIDVGAAYVGISSFNPWIVGSLLAINTFSVPILWTIFAFATEKELKFYSSFLFDHRVQSDFESSKKQKG